MSTDDRARIVDVFNETASTASTVWLVWAYLDLRPTASSDGHRRTIRRLDQTPARPPKVDAEMREFLVMLVEEAPTITLKDNGLKTIWPQSLFV